VKSTTDRPNDRNWVIHSVVKYLASRQLQEKQQEIKADFSEMSKVVF